MHSDVILKINQNLHIIIFLQLKSVARVKSWPALSLHERYRIEMALFWLKIQGANIQQFFADSYYFDKGSGLIFLDPDKGHHTIIGPMGSRPTASPEHGIKDKEPYLMFPFHFVFLSFSYFSTTSPSLSLLFLICSGRWGEEGGLGKPQIYQA